MATVRATLLERFPDIKKTLGWLSDGSHSIYNVFNTSKSKREKSKLSAGYSDIKKRSFDRGQDALPFVCC